jgi:adenylate kinase
MNIVMLGAPGAGKGTYAQRITAKYGLPVLATGDLFRHEMENKTELGKQITEVMESGQLVPDEITVELIKKKLSLIRNGAVFDGFPRNVQQAESLDKLLEEKGEKVDYVLYINTPKSVIVKRISGRLYCKNCGAVYHAQNIPPKVIGICDKCGKALYQRDDDKPDKVKLRFETYKKETAPLIKYYEKKGMLRKISGKKPLEDALKDIYAIIDKA